MKVIRMRPRATFNHRSTRVAAAVLAGLLLPARVEPAPDARAGDDWWSLQPLSTAEPPVPPGLPAGWESPIDRFIFAALAARGLSPSPPADRRTLIRRANYDVLGLPPTPEEVEAFVGDAGPDAFDRLVDRLLASPHHGERWGRFWLDVVRFGESNGYERNILYPNAWPYRDYVIASLNDDKPFDRFIREQIAADAIAAGQPDVEVATAFLVCGPFDDVSNQDPAAAAQIRANDLDDMVRATSEAILGMTVGCARCHDHKFDPIPTADYYRTQAAFAGVWHGSRTLATAAERDSREQALAPLLAQREKLIGASAAIEQQILTRAAALPPAVKPALPRIDPYLTEDRFESTTATAVRLVILANDRDPRGGGGFRLDELEVWSDEPIPRNVALAESGACAIGPDRRVAESVTGAYSVQFVNDGRFDVKWLAPPRATVTIKLARPERINRVNFSSDRNRDLGREHPENTFVGEYRLEVSVDEVSWTTVADSAHRAPVNEGFARERTLRSQTTAAERDDIADFDRQLEAVEKRLGAVPVLRQVWAGDFRAPPTSTFVLVGGDPQRPGAEVTSASLDFLKAAGKFQLAANAPDAERRLALARWLVSAANPLTPRVLANRVWQSHFSTGIVDTPSDFGWLGGRPSHPELLDWLARRLLERGVRYVSLYCASRASGVDGLLNWDAHKTLKADYERHCPIFDQPTAALLTDLKQRGLLSQTLVLWTSELGRMPTHQEGTTGRDHNPDGFTCWMMGSGVRGGVSHGATDDFGRRAVVNPTTVYDFYATVLHLLGIDHESLTFYHNGTNRRLTDVHGQVIREILA